MGRFLKNTRLRSGGYATVLPGASTALRPLTPPPGDIRFNTDLNQIEAYFTSNNTPAWYPLAHIGSVSIVKDTFTGDGTTATFNMSKTYARGQETLVIAVVGNIFQNPGVAFTFSPSPSNVITFTSTPPLGQTIIVLHGYASTNAA